MRKKLFCLFLLIAAISFSAYAGAATTVKFPPAPVYNPTEPIPLTVGINVDEGPAVQSHGKSKADHPYGSAIVEELKKMKVFSNIVYPYKKGVSADAVVHLDIKGKWEYYNGEHRPYDYWAGSSSGHFAEGTHEIKIVMEAAGKKIINDSISVQSRGQYSGRDYDLVAGRLNDAQTKKIAVMLARLFQDKEDHIMAQIEGRPVKTAISSAASSVINTGSIETKKAPVKAGSGIETKLKEIEELHASGVLSDEDFGKVKTRLLQMQKLEDLYKDGVLSQQEYERARGRLLKK